MTATLERIPLIGTLRVFADGRCFEDHDPYEWACGVRRLDDETCELVGAMRAPTKEMAWAIAEELRAAGFSRVIETRYVDGTKRTVEHLLTRNGGTNGEGGQ